MNVSFHLSRLQKIDTQLDQTNNRLNEIERILADNQAVKLAEQGKHEAQTELQKAQKALKQCEESVNSQRMKIELDESALYGGKVRNPKELQDIQNEVASLKKYLVTLEDQQLNAMVLVEEAEETHDKALKNLAHTQEEAAQASASLLGEQSKLNKEKERLTAEREEIVSQVSAQHLAAYTRLRQQKRGVAVAAVIDESCTVCGASITPADWQAARSPHQIVYCSSCGRILYAG